MKCQVQHATHELFPCGENWNLVSWSEKSKVDSKKAQNVNGLAISRGMFVTVKILAQAKREVTQMSQIMEAKA